MMHYPHLLFYCDVSTYIVQCIYSNMADTDIMPIVLVVYVVVWYILWEKNTHITGCVHFSVSFCGPCYHNASDNHGFLLLSG